MPLTSLLKLARIALLAALLPWSAAHAQSADGAPRLSAADDAAVRAWLRKAARPLSSASPTASELKPMLARLAGARVVGIGEATHGTREETVFKTALVKALVGAGRINAVAFIVSTRGGRRLDTYVAGGPGSAADALRESGVTPVLLTQEVADLLDWLRTWNAARPDRIRIVGVDVQDVLNDTRDALAFFAAIEPDAAVALQDVWKPYLTEDSLRRPFPDVAREWTRAQWEPLFVASQVLEDLLARPGTRLAQAPGHAEARQAARAARLGLLVHEVGADTASTPSATDVDLARDLAIGDQLLAIVGPPARAALWAHDAQVARTGTAASAAFTTGDLLLDRLGTAYRTIGFAWRRGVFHALGRDAAGNVDVAAGLRTWTVTQPPNSLGALLARTGQQRAWFDLRALPEAGWAQRWLAVPYDRGWVGIAYGGDWPPATPLGIGFDALVFFDTITPSRPLAP